MSERSSIEQRIAVMERRVRLLTLACVALGGAALLGAYRPSTDIVRARALVITDAAGRERVILGAPMEAASSNALLRGAIGMAVLDTLGRLQVAVGRDNPLVMAGGRTGQRIASATGLTFYDPRTGEERGGMGAFADGRANVCVDYEERGKEAVCITAAPNDQYAAVIVNGTPKEPQFDRVVMYAGADGLGQIKFEGGHTTRSAVVMQAGKGPAKAIVYDTTGKIVRELVFERP